MSLAWWTAAKLAVVLAAVAWPLLAGGVPRDALAQGNVDVGVLAAAASAAAAAQAAAGAPDRVVAWTAAASQLLLLAKAVAVAVLAPDKAPVLPRPQAAGLLCIFVSTAAALLGSLGESGAARAAAGARRAARRRHASGGDAAEPLLGGEGDDDAKLEGGGGVERRATVRTLLALSAPDALVLAAAFTAGGAAALGTALVPHYTGKIIDAASIDPDAEVFLAMTVRLLAVAAAAAAATGVRGGLFTLCMTRLNVRLRQRLLESLLRQEPAFFDATTPGELTSRLAADTTTVSDQISLNLNVAVRSTLAGAATLAFMLRISWRLTTVTLVLVPLVVAVCRVYGAWYRRLSKRVQSALAEANGAADEALAGVATVKAHAAERSCGAAYAGRLAAFAGLMRRAALAYGAYMAVSTMLNAAVTAVVLFYGGRLVLSGQLSAGALVSFMLFQGALSSAFQALGDVFSSLSAAVGAADKVVELLRRRPAFPAGGALAVPDFRGALELRDVHFAYPSRPGRPVLRGLSLAVAPGEVVALVGPSGGGKSSVVRLLENFYRASAGAVLVDGRDVGAYAAPFLKRRVALVSQEPVLFARSVRRNILFGVEAEDGLPPDEVPTDADVEAAARLANAHDFISALPQGYDTECGDRGVRLSGGQKQRVAIARALVRRPQVLLLDEATSALDAESEALVQGALDATMRGRTVLVIAHRLSTVQGAHRIVVVQDGRAVEEGPHDELVSRGGAYAALVRRQLGGLSRSASGSRAPSAADLHAL